MLGYTENKNTIIDTLYGGLNGELPDCEYVLPKDLIISDQTKQKPESGSEFLSNMKKQELEVIPAHEVAAASTDEVDIRPRVWDGVSKSWILVDTGSQVSVFPPSPDDVVQPHLKIETVDGSNMDLSFMSNSLDSSTTELTFALKQCQQALATNCGKLRSVCLV